MTAQPLNSTFRTAFYHLLTFTVSLYAVALTCSMAGMEIFGWTSFFFCLMYIITDRMAPKPSLETHTIGVELPIILYLLVVVLGLKINASGTDYIFAFGNLRNFALMFMFTFALQAYKNLNRIINIMWFCGTIIAIYAIWQHFSGIDLWRHDHRALQEIPFGPAGLYASVGFFSHHLTYGHSYMMLLCIPWAAIMLARNEAWWKIMVYAISFSIILTSLIFAYGRGVWIAILVALPIMAFFASRKLFLIALVVLLGGGGILYKANPQFRDRVASVFADNYRSNDNRRKLWDANIEMFHDHPWIGIGSRQNEARADEYFKRLNITDALAGHSHSNYVELLSTNGILGFVFYMIFILAFILMTARLFSTIPTSHYWHRVIALSALGAQIAFHVGGLTQWNFGDAEVQHQFLFWLAIVAYMSHQYYAHIVPDDHSL